MHRTTNEMGLSPRLGVVEPQSLYTLEAFKRDVGISDATLRTARREGLKVYRKSRRGFILGKDWIDYVTGKPN